MRYGPAEGPSLKLHVNFVERSGQFGGTDARGAEFADDHTRRRVGQISRLRQRGARGNRQGKHAENGVPSSRHIKDLPSGSAAFDAGLADAGVSNLETGCRNMAVLWRVVLEKRSFPSRLA